jgi:hypothetical protein
MDEANYAVENLHVEAVEGVVESRIVEERCST